MNKKGYFFMLDAFLGLTILIIGFFLIFSSYGQEPEQLQISFSSEDVLKFLSSTKIEDINNEYAGLNGKLWKEGNITNPHNTLLQQIGEFYFFDKKQLIDDFVSNTTKMIFPKQYSFEIWLNETLVYPKDASMEHNLSKEKTTILFPARTIVFAVANETTKEIWGPYSVEVFVWG